MEQMQTEDRQRDDQDALGMRDQERKLFVALIGQQLRPQYQLKELCRSR
jgi:hypothetical protein